MRKSKERFTDGVLGKSFEDGTEKYNEKDYYNRFFNIVKSGHKEKFTPRFNYFSPTEFGIGITYGNDKTEYIPFQFNPQAVEGAITAQYQAIQVLHRFGALQEYTGTDSLTLTLNTSYIATNKDGKSTSDSPNDINEYFYNNFTMLNLNKYENLFRSVVYPNISIDGETTKFNLPPIIRIHIGDILYSRPNKTGKLVKRTFVTTSVSVTKDFNEFPFLLSNGYEQTNSNGSISMIEVGRQVVNTMGFAVSMTLLEVDTNYFIENNYDGYQDYIKLNEELGQ
jgi:hypothetical protein